MIKQSGITKERAMSSPLHKDTLEPQDEVINVYIGISKRFEPIAGLTQRSILANTEADVNITYLYPRVEAGCTGFSNVRYSIRKGVYLDCDMIVLGDIAELWSYHQEGKFVCMKDGSTEVAVIDCIHNCTDKKREGKLPKSCIIPPEWNVEDYKYFPNEPLPENIKLFHFTSLDHQPWFYEHPNEEAIALYERYLQISGS